MAAQFFRQHGKRPAPVDLSEYQPDSFIISDSGSEAGDAPEREPATAEAPNEQPRLREACLGPQGSNDDDGVVQAAFGAGQGSGAQSSFDTRVLHGIGHPEESADDRMQNVAPMPTQPGVIAFGSHMEGVTDAGHHTFPADSAQRVGGMENPRGAQRPPIIRTLANFGKRRMVNPIRAAKEATLHEVFQAGYKSMRETLRLPPTMSEVQSDALCRVALVCEALLFTDPEHVTPKELVKVFYLLVGDSRWRSHYAMPYYYNFGKWERLHGFGFDQATTQVVAELLSVVEGCFWLMGPAGADLVGEEVQREWSHAKASIEKCIVGAGLPYVLNITVEHQCHLKRAFRNPYKEAHWAELQADMVKRLSWSLQYKMTTEFFMKEFCQHCESPMPVSRGLSFNDCFMEEVADPTADSGSIWRCVRGKAASNDCYAGVDYDLLWWELPGQESDPRVASEAKELGEERQHILGELVELFETTFINNEALYVFFMCCLRLAHAGRGPRRCLFLEDEGGKGKSLLSLFMSKTWGSAWRFADPNIFYADEEFRKAGDRLHGASFIAVQEKGEHAMKVDLWKKTQTNEEMCIRPNFGKKTYMLRFGTAFWLWELNAPPRAYFDKDKKEAVLRRSAAGHFRLKLTAEEAEVDEANGVFRRKPSLEALVTNPKSAAVFMHDLFMSFCEMFSEERCLELVDDLGLLDRLYAGTIRRDTELFVTRMCAGGEGQDAAGDVGEKILASDMPDDALVAEATMVRDKLLADGVVRVTNTVIEKAANLVPVPKKNRVRRFHQYLRLHGFFEAATGLWGWANRSAAPVAYKVIVPELRDWPELRGSGRVAGYNEPIDTQSLAEHVRAGADPRDRQAARLLEEAVAHQGKVPRTYRYVSFGAYQSGRRLASSYYSLQFVSRACRLACSSPQLPLVEVDIVNTMPTIAFHSVKNILPASMAGHGGLSGLDDYVNRRNACVVLVQKVFMYSVDNGAHLASQQCTFGDAKQLFIRLLFQDTVANWMDACGLRRRLADESRQVDDLLERYAKAAALCVHVVAQARPSLVDLFAGQGRRRPDVTAFFYALAEREDAALQLIEEAVRAAGMDVAALMFDGVLVPCNDIEALEATCRNGETLIGEKMGLPLRLALKKLVPEHRHDHAGLLPPVQEWLSSEHVDFDPPAVAVTKLPGSGMCCPDAIVTLAAVVGIKNREKLHECFDDESGPFTYARVHNKSEYFDISACVWKVAGGDAFHEECLRSRLLPAGPFFLLHCGPLSPEATGHTVGLYLSGVHSGAPGVTLADNAQARTTRISWLEFCEYLTNIGSHVIFPLHLITCDEPVLSTQAGTSLGDLGPEGDLQAGVSTPAEVATSAELQTALRKEGAWAVDTMFRTPASFQSFIVGESHLPGGVQRTERIMRAVVVLLHFGVIESLQQCPACAGQVRMLPATGRNSPTWVCCQTPSKKGHLAKVVRPGGELAHVYASWWMAFLHYVVYMRSGARIKNMVADMRALYGLSHDTVARWTRLYSSVLKRYLVEVELVLIGRDGNEVVSIDESAFGHIKSVAKKPAGTLVVRTMPGKTVWRRPAARPQKGTAQKRASFLARPSRKMSQVSHKRPAGKIAKKPSNGGKKLSSVRWLWGAVECGPKGGAKKSHKLKNKRVFMKMLPKAEDALAQKPRGKETLAQAMLECLSKDCHLVADEWLATPPAAIAAGQQLMGSCNHSRNYRNPATGVHSNDIESEWARFKLWYRTKFAFVRAGPGKSEEAARQVIENHMWEYMYYTNVGDSMDAVMRAFQYDAKH